MCAGASIFIPEPYKQIRNTLNGTGREVAHSVIKLSKSRQIQWNLLNEFYLFYKGPVPLDAAG